MTHLLLLGLAATLATLLGLEAMAPVLPDPVDRPQATIVRAPAPPTIDEDALDALVATALARPVVTPGRRGADAPPAAEPEDADAQMPRLSGVMLGPAGRRAIFAPSRGRPLVLAEGDSVGDYTITAIAPNTVTLSGSEGDRLIRPTHSRASTKTAPLARP